MYRETNTCTCDEKTSTNPNGNEYFLIKRMLMMVPLYCFISFQRQTFIYDMKRLFHTCSIYFIYFNSIIKIGWGGRENNSSQVFPYFKHTCVSSSLFDVVLVIPLPRILYRLPIFCAHISLRLLITTHNK